MGTTTDIDPFVDLVRDRYAGRRIVCVGGVAAAWSLDSWREVGAGPFLIVGPRGMGPVPEGDDVERFDIELGPADDMMGEFRAWERLAADPPEEVSAAIDAFDPACDGLVLAPPFVTFTTFGGRPVHGARPHHWSAFEDKTLVDAFWDRIGVPRAPAEIVAVPDAPAAAARLDAGAGTVWSGDARGGFNGGVTRVRWLRPGDDPDELVTFYESDHDQVRVVPFLEGVPCSIHGFVTATGVVVFRPCEMVILRSPTAFVYAGAATFWDPEPADRADMEDAVRWAAEALRYDLEFRGAFTIDGVMTIDGFRPTELNPRPGAALRVPPDLPLGLLQREVVADPDFDVPVEELERIVNTWSATERSGGSWTFTRHPIAEGEHGIVQRDDGYALGDAKDEDRIATVVMGPTATGGGLVRIVPEPAKTLVGPPFGPRAAELWRVLDEPLDLRLGALSAAEQVR